MGNSNTENGEIKEQLGNVEGLEEIQEQGNNIEKIQEKASNIGNFAGQEIKQNQEQTFEEFIGINNNQLNQSENAGDIVGGLQGVQEQAGYVGTINEVQGNIGYVGGFIGKKLGQEHSDYVGGIVTAPRGQTIDYDEIEEDTNSQNLPVKQGFWSKIKAILFTGNSADRGLYIGISQKTEKVLSEVHDFLFQDISFKGFMNILKIGKDRK